MPHTPVTWTLDPIEDDDGYFTIRVADGSEHGDTSEHPIGTAYHEDNGQLMAASPDLAAALQRLINCHTGAPWQTAEVQREAWLAASAALRKAGIQ